MGVIGGEVASWAVKNRLLPKHTPAICTNKPGNGITTPLAPAKGVGHCEPAQSPLAHGIAPRPKETSNYKRAGVYICKKYPAIAELFDRYSAGKIGHSGRDKVSAADYARDHGLKMPRGFMPSGSRGADYGRRFAGELLPHIEPRDVQLLWRAIAPRLIGTGFEHGFSRALDAYAANYILDTYEGVRSLKAEFDANADGLIDAGLRVRGTMSPSEYLAGLLKAHVPKADHQLLGMALNHIVERGLRDRVDDHMNYVGHKYFGMFEPYGLYDNL